MHRFLRALLVVLFVAGASAPALAKKGVVVVNTGDELFAVAPFPADVVKQYPRTADIQVGYKCSHFGLFWADVWTWNCQLVAVTGENSYADLPPAIHDQLAADPRYAFGEAKRGYWNHYGFPTLVLGLLALFALVIWSALPRRGTMAQAPGTATAG